MSSSSTFGQVLQSCLEPPQVLIPSKQSPSLFWLLNQAEYPGHRNPMNNNCQEIHPTNTFHDFIEASDEAEEVYVHPLAKRSWTSSLSLDMCTESLGNETGSSSMDEYSNHALEMMSSSKIQNPKAGDMEKKVKKIISFPPPLSSLVQIESFREEGRLVMRAISSSSCSSYFRAERENGRLRLSLFRDGYRGDDCQNCGDEEEEEEGEGGGEEEKEVELEDANGDDHDPEPEIHGLFWGETVKENEGKVGCWCISRCNGDGNGNKRITSLPFCVAIS